MNGVELATDLTLFLDSVTFGNNFDCIYFAFGFYVFETKLVVGDGIDDRDF